MAQHKRKMINPIENWCSLNVASSPFISVFLDCIAVHQCLFCTLGGFKSNLKRGAGHQGSYNDTLLPHT